MPAERRGRAALGQLWAALPAVAADAPLLAAAYPVEAATTRQVAADLAQLESLRGEPAGLDDLAAAIRWRTGISAGGSVQLVRPRADWAQLVLPPAKLAVLREAVALAAAPAPGARRPAGCSPAGLAPAACACFSRPAGAPANLLAEVLARALGVDLLVVDLSRVLSKWIGETEKNLAEVFATAEKARAVLLFDEADALFGKRTEVQDAHDRYANLETAYLLGAAGKIRRPGHPRHQPAPEPRPRLRAPARVPGRFRGARPRGAAGLVATPPAAGARRATATSTCRSWPASSRSPAA